MLSCFLLFGDNFQVVQVNFKDEIFSIEIADTPEKRERGLMYRRHLGKNDGMLFVFFSDDIRSFWMKNTYIPLSIAYIDVEGRINEIYNMDSQSLHLNTSKTAFRYALEVNQGTFKRIGVKVGSIVEFITTLVDE